jgi:glycosyltransferase involved in cell wall biosynthesis
VLEAIGCDVFPVCRDLPGARLITRTYCGRLVDGPDAASEAASFLAGADLAALRAESAGAGRRLSRDYDWPSCVAVLERAVAAVAQRVPAA